MLALALETVKLTKRQKGVLHWVIEHTKTLADRRNELIHAEYVVHGRTNKLHAKVKPPRSHKPAKHQKAAASDLKVVVADLQLLVQATEAAWFEFATRSTKKLMAGLRKIAADVQRSRENPQSG